MYRFSIKAKPWICIAIVALLCAFCLSLIMAIPTIRDQFEILTPGFVAITLFVFFGIMFVIIGVLFPKYKEGVSILKPEDFIDESFVFCPIKEEGNCWLATINDFSGKTVALSQLDFAPKNRVLIQESLDNSIKQGERLSLKAYGCQIRKGSIFSLIDEEEDFDQKEKLVDAENLGANID